jgi:hypothetical protein
MKCLVALSLVLAPLLGLITSVDSLELKTFASDDCTGAATQATTIPVASCGPYPANTAYGAIAATNGTTVVYAVYADSACSGAVVDAGMKQCNVCYNQTGVTNPGYPNGTNSDIFDCTAGSTIVSCAGVLVALVLLCFVF